MPMYRNQWQDYTDDHWEVPKPKPDSWHIAGWLEMTDEEQERALQLISDIKSHGIKAAIEMHRDTELRYEPIALDDATSGRRKLPASFLFSFQEHTARHSKND